MSNLAGPTYLSCANCNLRIPFYSSVAQCFRCGTWTQLQDSPRSGKVIVLKSR